MPACNSCGNQTTRREWCPNLCQAKLCKQCASPPEHWPKDAPTTFLMNIGEGIKWHLNRCRFCRRRGAPMTGEQFRKLDVGDWFWVVYAKDGNPDDLRFNCPQRIVEFQDADTILCADWSFTGTRKGPDEEWGFPDLEDSNAHDTSRGDAYYFHFRHPEGPHEFRLSRLMEFDMADDPWAAGFHMDMIGKGKSLEPEPYSLSTTGAMSAEWHAGRIRYLMQSPEDLAQPISMDSECSGMQVLPEPIIVDGWHRYFAHLWQYLHYHGPDMISATFGGLVDVCEYLEGLTDEKPWESA